MSFQFDDLNSDGEPYTENYFRQLVVPIEATPAVADNGPGIAPETVADITDYALAVHQAARPM